ncbi:hypothetical protein LUZ60_001210 [Juncus effusus]|nr:hypothetical protein LUZ60_001210 [Juncus effusus]
MAAMIASKRAHLARLLEKVAFSPLRPAVAAPYITRSFNSNALREYEDDRHAIDEENSAVSRRPGFFAGKVLDPFNTRSLSQVLNMMDQMMNDPFTVSSRGSLNSVRRGWDAREEADALHLRVDMPGLGKENVKIWAENGTLVIKGEGEKEQGEEESAMKYSSRIDLPAEQFKMDQITAEMKNGVLKVVVPKVKPEERKDVFEVNVE